MSMTPEEVQRDKAAETRAWRRNIKALYAASAALSVASLVLVSIVAEGLAEYAMVVVAGVLWQLGGEWIAEARRRKRQRW